ncbi:MAG: phosphatidate cytidylyltransferase [Spirochaetia bacterium]|jgi:phosphatidate cytidylyltransferase|nr:phosphatidate cytidylyltransferase [Spirochaetia bacterium]
MTSLKGRLLTTFVGIPAVAIIVFALPQFAHLGFALLAAVAGILGTYEMKQMMEKSLDIHIFFPCWFGTLLPLASWAEVYFNLESLMEIVFVLMLFCNFISELRTGTKDEDPFSKSIIRIATSSLLVFYPSFLLTFLVAADQLPHGPFFLGLFFICVFSNDIFAFLCGMTFGRHNRGFIKVSPNKSIAGFVGGTVASMFFATLYVYLFPSLRALLSIPMSLVLGFVLAFSGSLGDLLESVFKRSAKVKDSGHLVPGRGGALDNLDSLVVAAPLFYLALRILLT